MKRSIVVFLVLACVALLVYLKYEKDLAPTSSEVSESSPQTGTPDGQAPTSGTTEGAPQGGGTESTSNYPATETSEGGAPSQAATTPEGGTTAPEGKTKEGGAPSRAARTTEQGVPSRVGEAPEDRAIPQVGGMTSEGTTTPEAAGTAAGVSRQKPGQAGDITPSGNGQASRVFEAKDEPVTKTGAGKTRAAPGTGSVSTGGFAEKSPETSAGSTEGRARSGGEKKAVASKVHSGVDGEGVSETPASKSKGAKPAAKVKLPTIPFGVKSPRVWLVASDLRQVAGTSQILEVGIPDGAKATPWKNRAGPKWGDGIRAGAGANATFLRDYPFRTGKFDAVQFCSPGMKDCLSTQPSQIKSGLDVNHADHWLSGPDKAGKSSKGGGSFTVLFVAARGSDNPNPLLEHQNGEANAKKGPFLGWIGTDLVGSIHGSQGIVSISAVAVPNPWTVGVPSPQIYTLRFSRKRGELRLFVVDGKGSEVNSVQIKNGDGPDNDQYAAIAMGSKNPGKGAATYVFEHLAYARALGNQDLCTIHREWSKKYGINTPQGEIKPCED